MTENNGRTDSSYNNLIQARTDYALNMGAYGAGSSAFFLYSAACIADGTSLAGILSGIGISFWGLVHLLNNSWDFTVVGNMMERTEKGKIKRKQIIQILPFDYGNEEAD